MATTLANVFDDFGSYNSSSVNLDNPPWDMSIIEMACRAPVTVNAVVVIMCIVCLVGIVGNTCLLLVIMCNRRLQNAPNVLIINVAVADLLYIFSNAPFYMKHELGQMCWFHGLLACQLRHYIPQIAQGACIFSLAALSRERYVAIVEGIESRVTRSLRRTIITTCIGWMFGVFIATPVLLLTSISAYGMQCSYLPLDETSSEAYVVIIFLFVYVIPLTFITYHYCLIARSLCRSSVSTLARNSMASMEQMRARRRLAHVVLVITVFFGVFWLPHHVYSLWFMFTKYTKVITENGPIVRVFRYMDYYMALANSCLNPWIVFIMSSVHRYTLRNLGSSCRSFRSHGSNRNANKLSSGILGRPSTSNSLNNNANGLNGETVGKLSASNGINEINTKL